MAALLANYITNRFCRIKLPVGPLTNAQLKALAPFSKKVNDTNVYGLAGTLTDVETNHPGEFEGPFTLYGVGFKVHAADPANPAAAADIAQVTDRLGAVLDINGREKNIGPVYAHPVPFGLRGEDKTISAPISIINNGGVEPTRFKEPIDLDAGDKLVLGLRQGLQTVTLTGEVIVDMWLFGEGVERTAAL